MTRPASHRPGRWTPPGSGGVAVVSLGDEAEARNSLARLGVERMPARGDLGLVRLRDGDEDLDEALLVNAPDGHVELHLHGSPPLVARLQDLLGVNASATPITAHADRAAALVAGAPSELGARVLLDQAQGAFDRALNEGVHAADLTERGRAARFLLERTRVVIAGPVNAGKSTLFNALVGAERATVSSEEGTTRDAVRADGRLGPWPVEWVDTAGERDLSQDVPGDVHSTRVERAGQELGRALAAEARLVLWLEPEGHGAATRAPDDVPHLVRLVSRASDPARPGHLAALEDPSGARARVADAFAQHFRLDPQEAWLAGRAVPFDRTSRAAVGGVPGAADRDDPGAADRDD